jgi:hypothetical protein
LTRGQLRLSKQAIGARFAAAEARCADAIAEFVEIKTGKRSDALEHRPKLAEAQRRPERQKPHRGGEALPPIPRRPSPPSSIKRVPFMVTGLGANPYPFMQHLYPNAAERSSADLD